MARNHTANSSLAQGRNRVTNKTRLKVYTEGSNGNPILFRQNEDNVGMVSVAGVDREDANVSSIPPISILSTLGILRTIVSYTL